MESRKRQSHEWVAVAAREFTKIIHHLGLRSINHAANELGINYRTLKKLDERHPDPTLTMEKVMSIWHALEVFAVIIQSSERPEEVRRMLGDSLMQIVRSFSLNPRLQDAVEAIATDRVGTKTGDR